MFNRISKLSQEKGLSISALEKAVGLGNGIIGKWKKQSPSCDNLKLVADYLNVSIDYLVYGTQYNDTEPDINELISNYKSVDDTDKARIRERAATLAELTKEKLNGSPVKCNNHSKNTDCHITIKLFDSSVSAGTGIYIDYSSYTEITTNEDIGNANFAVRVSGDSMTPRFCDGDVVLVESTPCVDIGEIGIFIVNSTAYIKKLGNNSLISLNAKYPPINISENDSVYCQGKVIGVLDIRKKV